MGEFAVELLNEVIEPCLLQAVDARRAGGFLLEGDMHALMAPVLVGMARLDALYLNAEPDLPDTNALL